MPTPIPKRLLGNPLHLLSLGFGAGLAPKAPGTVGTAVAVLPYLALARLPLAWYLAAIGLAFAAGVGLCRYTSHRLGVDDHPGIVWDEFVGFWIAMIAVPPQWQWILLGFVLFRVFDVFKPWPVSVADSRLHGGFGIMLDDVLAGIYALGGMHLALWLW